ncbi:MAG: hypothetical protein IAE90_05260 [Ignavibacteria bacterium]|nr:hypothetical protein [Ignavibacteria bacterium]
MKTLAVLLLIALQGILISQTDSSEVFALPKMLIKQKGKSDDVLYRFDNNINKFTLAPERLTFDTLRYNYSVELAKIRQVHFAKGSAFWNVAVITGAVGFGLGFLFGGFFDFNPHPTFHVDRAILGGGIVAVPFALIGGIIGALFDNYDSYDLKTVPKNKRYEYFKKLLTKYRVKPYR